MVVQVEWEMVLSVVAEEVIYNGKDLDENTKSKVEPKIGGKKYALEGPAMPSGRLSTSITSVDRERGCRVDDETNWISSSSRRSTSITSARWTRVSVAGVCKTVADIVRATIDKGGDGRGCSQS